MRIPILSLSEQYKAIEPEITAAIKEVLNSSRFILGQQAELFEKEFAEYCGIDNAIGVNSGTDAIFLALKALGIKEGDEVITVPNTAIPTVSAIRMTGAKPVFVDIDEATYLMNPELLPSKITPKTKAIVPVHLYGQCCEMKKITAIAKENGLFVVEDACQAHGAEYAGKKAGTLSDIGCFSFYPSKNLGAYGDGGMIVTNNPVLAEKVKMMRNYGQPQRYVCSIEGINSRLDEIQAAILRVKLKHLDNWNKKRVEYARLYKALIKNDKITLPFESSAGKHAHHLFVIRTKERDKLKKFLEEKEIGTEIHYPIPIHLQKGYEFLMLKEGTCPVAETAMKEILSLPLYPELKREQITYVADKINAF